MHIGEYGIQKDIHIKIYTERNLGMGILIYIQLYISIQICVYVYTYMIAVHLIKIRFSMYIYANRGTCISIHVCTSTRKNVCVNDFPLRRPCVSFPSPLAIRTHILYFHTHKEPHETGTRCISWTLLT